MKDTPYYFNWLSKYMGVAIARQKLFGEIISGASRWRLDMDEGTIIFDDLKFPFSFLGTESDMSNTWLWAWVNIDGDPESFYKESEVFHRNCMLMHMEELKDAQLPLTNLVNGNTIASMAVVAASDCFQHPMIADMGHMCYYRAPYDGGAAFLLLRNIPDEIFQPAPGALVITALSEAVAYFKLHHGHLVDGIMEFFATDVKKDENTVTGKFRDGTILTSRFDQQGRIRQLSIEVDRAKKECSSSAADVLTVLFDEQGHIQR